eukprot:TRINITY_DN2109_c5_g1_i1.p1 TRINITY_DN2109_c5_g1~~TRINITY_DN2109_c5_g1_i1.p1  ORF type:complete len:794 (+),score=320.27 TRINITY_DN2109_c5_g1_i1:75-2456(+)
MAQRLTMLVLVAAAAVEGAGRNGGPSTGPTPSPGPTAEERLAVMEEAVERLKGVAATMGRQLIETEARLEERVRAEGHSGVSKIRSKAHGDRAYHQEAHVGEGGPAAAHNHADFKDTIGMGEFQAVMNGVQFTTRHNDFDFRQPDETLSEEAYTGTFPPQARLIDTPDVPPAVAALATVEEQVAEMIEWFRAFKDQNVTHRDYRPYFKANMCYLEGGWMEAQPNITEPFASDRHSIDASTWKDLHEKQLFLQNSGMKDMQENLPFLPSSFRAMREGAGKEFEPRTAQWFYRIQCQTLPQDVPTTRLRVKRDLLTMFKRIGVNGQGNPATLGEMAQTHSARFDLNPKQEGNWAAGDAWPQGWRTFDYLDELMAEVPGFNGPRAVLYDTSMGPPSLEYRKNAALNVARYSRWYDAGADAMMQSKQKRGFNDNVFMAKTTHPAVSPLVGCNQWSGAELERWGSAADKERTAQCTATRDPEACRAYEWDAADVDGGAASAHCTWTPQHMCVYKKCWESRWTYALPLEIVYSTPLQKWNPYGLAFHEAGTPGFDTVEADGRNGMPETPFNGTHGKRFYRTPDEFFAGETENMPGSTSNGVMWAENPAGEKCPVRASGTYVLLPPVAGVGAVRQRYPIMPVHEEGTLAWKETKALADVVIGHDRGVDPHVRRMLQEAKWLQYGVELSIAHPTHSHKVVVAAAELRQLLDGTVRVQNRIAYGTMVNGEYNNHYVGISYNPTDYGNEWKLAWCTSIDVQIPCPDAVVASGQCGSLGPETYATCCPGVCPDGGVLTSPDTTW